METAYGIGIRNRYAIFQGEEDEDPLEVLSKKEEEKKSTKSGAKSDSQTNQRALLAASATKDSAAINKTKQAIAHNQTNKSASSNTNNKQSSTAFAKPRGPAPAKTNNADGAKPREANKQSMLEPAQRVLQACCFIDKTHVCL